MIGYIYIVYTVYIIYYIILNYILYINNEDSRRNTSYHFKSRDPSPTCGMYVHHINAKPKETDPDTQAQKKWLSFSQFCHGRKTCGFGDLRVNLSVGCPQSASCATSTHFWSPTQLHFLKGVDILDSNLQIVVMSRRAYGWVVVGLCNCLT